MNADAVIAEMVSRLAAGFDPYRVVLFGSRARDDGSEDSDVDLLVVMPDGTDRRKIPKEMEAALQELPLKGDIVLTTPDLIAKSGHLVTGVLRPALAEGRIIHERDPPSPELATAVAVSSSRRNAIDDNDPDAVADAQWWIFRARSAIEYAELSLGMNRKPRPFLARHACLYSQEAAEKALKAALGLEGIEHPVSGELKHHLPTLWNLLAAGWSAGGVDVKALERLSEWWLPHGGDEDELRQPTTAEAIAAEATARAVYNGVLAELDRRGLTPPSFKWDDPA